MAVMEKKPKSKWGGRLQALRLRKGLSQERAAAYLQVPVSTLRGWEQGRHTPSPYVQRFVTRLLEQHGG
jgi:DNA-binding transcriptional regulator YiaG